MIKLTTNIVKSTDLWSKINLCTKSLILWKINDKKFSVWNRISTIQVEWTLNSVQHIKKSRVDLTRSVVGWLCRICMSILSTHLRVESSRDFLLCRETSELKLRHLLIFLDVLKAWITISFLWRVPLFLCTGCSSWLNFVYNSF
jgi:hypothetical protein